MKLKIYPGKGEMYDEVTIHKDAELDEASKEKKTYLRLEDRVEQLYGVLEKMIDHQPDVAGRSGIKVRLRARKHLEGWDVKDLATQRDPFYPRVATLDAYGKGWPAGTEKLCSAWAKLPTNKYYLAACISDPQEIIEEDGDPDANPIKITDGIIWHAQGPIFEPCQCVRGRARHSDLAQVLFPSNLSYILPKRKPIQLEGYGAVIFGHNMFFKWIWKNIGDPEKGDLPLLPEEPETLFHDSAIGPSVGSSTGYGGDPLADSISSQQLAHRIPRKPLPVPP
ncbi:hypothetical protein BGZ60DRAFT_530565 [Tricladium varicosporioides]|nr:hypothetical protein BGZ60DRAFT_530565 [Hymenoscyphus varicosporioides]